MAQGAIRLAGGIRTLRDDFAIMQEVYHNLQEQGSKARQMKLTALVGDDTAQAAIRYFKEAQENLKHARFPLFKIIDPRR